MKSIISNSKEETQQIAEDLAKNFNSGIIALSGDLGAGKTTFTQGFAKGLKIKDKIISPTFVLMRQHPIPKLKKNLYHIDLYRLDSKADIKNTGIEEIINNPENITIIEWAEKIRDLLPSKTTFIEIKILDLEKREIIFS